MTRRQNLLIALRNEILDTVWLYFLPKGKRMLHMIDEILDEEFDEPSVTARAPVRKD